MPEYIKIIQFTGTFLFLVTNIILLFIFLTPKRSRVFQIISLIATLAAGFFFGKLIASLNSDPLFNKLATGVIFIVPCMLIFRETIQAKIFIFFMNYSLSLFILLMFMYIDQFLSPAIPKIYVLPGLVLELALLPLVKKNVRSLIRNIIGIINQQHPFFTVFPILSFLLLSSYCLQKIYSLSEFIILTLSTLIIFFAYYMIAVAISETSRRQKFEHISSIDKLTGIYNRRYIEQKIKEECIRYERTGVQFSLVIADIDYFKNINDTYGHDCGDFLLKSISEDLSKSVRTYDTVARWGGDEFLILLPSTDKEQGINMAERIRRTVESHKYDRNNVTMTVTLTLGVYVARTGDTIDDMLKKADMALYDGKRKSRNCVVLYKGTVDSDNNINL
jgi:diguanylate cyclase (GGDEF)-like protein